MREILFRAKAAHTIDHEWIEGCVVVKPYESPELRVMMVVSIELEDGSFVTGGETVIPETVGQFTGLTDKNGKKVFEGDICRVSRPCVLAYGQITFQNGCFWFVDEGPGGMLRLCDVKMNGFEIEVVGNIHDNPELLDQKEGE